MTNRIVITVFIILINSSLIKTDDFADSDVRDIKKIEITTRDNTTHVFYSKRLVYENQPYLQWYRKNDSSSYTFDVSIEQCKMINRSIKTFIKNQNNSDNSNLIDKELSSILISSITFYHENDMILYNGLVNGDKMPHHLCYILYSLILESEYKRSLENKYDCLYIDTNL